MVYIIGAKVRTDNTIVYKAYETNTDSTFFIENRADMVEYQSKKLKTTIKSSLNGTWPNKEIQEDKKGNKTGSPYILMGRLADDHFKLISAGGLQYCNGNDLKKLIDQDKIANCGYTIQNGNKVYKSIDTEDIYTDKGYERKIAEKYKQFIAKSTMLGLDNQFRYRVDGTEVKLTDYYGKSSRVVLPDFITSIGEYAFFGSGVKSIKLNEGLRFIGLGAFDDCNIQKLEIPKSVEFVFEAAFKTNKQLYDKRVINKDNLKILGDNTILYR